MSTRLLKGDCLDRMSEIKDGSIDLILADLPYGTTALAWDSIIPLEPLWAHYRRLLKPGAAVVLTSSQPFTSMLVMSNPRWFRYEWIWHKNMPTGFLEANRKPLKDHESILVFCSSRAPYSPQGVERRRRRRRRRRRKSCTKVYGTFGSDYESTGVGFPRSVLKFANSRPVGHPSAKPVPLFEYLIRTYSKPGDLVMDNAMGSGSTALACLAAGRDFIGIESDPAYFALAESRIEALPKIEAL
jgi:DNA modification methylase